MNNKELKIILLISSLAVVIFSAVCFFVNIASGVICLALGTSVTAVFCIYTKRRYEKLNELNDYLSLVCAGNYDLDIADNVEGELSILKNNLYKVISLLRTQNEELKKDKLQLADSLADISHQLKTPLTSMMVMSDLLQEEKDEEKRGEFISVMTNQLQKMKWLIANLLKISKLDAGTVALNIEPASSADIIGLAAEPFAVMLDVKGIELVNNMPDFDINIDKQWTVEALQNIIKNCIEHTSANGRISITGKDTNIYSIIRIEDNGCGISEQDLPHIFERFYHGSNSSDESVGIGLALSKAILEKEHGEISVTSTINHGTTFEIKIYKAII